MRGLLRKPKLLAIILGVVAAIAFGWLFLNTPIPPITLHGEAIVNDLFGVWDLTNTTISAWIAIAVVLLLAFLATRKLSLVPRNRFQGLFEGLIEVTLGFVESVAGKERGRRFYPVVASIFLFILISNWLGLIPLYGFIGKVEKADHVIHDKAEKVIKDNERYKGLSTEDAKHTAELYVEGELTDEPLVREIDADLAKEKLFLFDQVGGMSMLPVGLRFNLKKEVDAKKYLVFQQITDTLEHGPITPATQAALKQQVVRLGLEDKDTEKALLEQVDGLGGATATAMLDASLRDELGIKEGKSAGLLLPYFRSAMTDLMSTLSLALVGMFMVELWGIRSNGFFSYAGRFFNLGALRRGKFIDFFVGFLEILSEIAKVISFSFRLFGNTLAGEVLIIVFLFLSPLVVGVLPFVFELFFGFIQATVFAVLILVFALIATESHGGGEHAHAKAHE